MTEKELKYHNLYLDIADRIGLMSFAIRAKVGAVLVKDNNIISFGWNGTPKNFDNCCEREVNQGLAQIPQRGLNTLETKPEVLHAESNCIAKIAKSSESSENSTLYITHSPCLSCAKYIIQCGIKKIYYRVYYKSKSEGDGIPLLNNAQISCIQIEEGKVIQDYL